MDSRLPVGPNGADRADNGVQDSKDTYEDFKTQKHRRDRDNGGYSREYDHETSYFPPSRHLWVGNLTSSTTEEDLQSEFGKYGKITSVTRIEGQNYGFVNFWNLKDAQNAKKLLQGVLLNGCPIHINYGRGANEGRTNNHREHQSYPDTSYTNTRHLWVGNLDKHVKEDVIRREFANFGTIDKVKIFYGKGYGFVDFKSISSATEAKQSLDGKPIGSSRIIVNFAKGQPSKRLWVGNVTDDMNQEELRELFCRYTIVENIKILRNRRCAFVDVPSEEEAEKVMDKCQGKWGLKLDFVTVQGQDVKNNTPRASRERRPFSRRSTEYSPSRSPSRDNSSSDDYDDRDRKKKKLEYSVNLDDKERVSPESSPKRSEREPEKRSDGNRRDDSDFSDSSFSDRQKQRKSRKHRPKERNRSSSRDSYSSDTAKKNSRRKTTSANAGITDPDVRPLTPDDITNSSTTQFSVTDTTVQDKQQPSDGGNTNVIPATTIAVSGDSNKTTTTPTEIDTPRVQPTENKERNQSNQARAFHTEETSSERPTQQIDIPIGLPPTTTKDIPKISFSIGRGNATKNDEYGVTDAFPQPSLQTQPPPPSLPPPSPPPPPVEAADASNVGQQPRAVPGWYECCDNQQQVYQQAAYSTTQYENLSTQQQPLLQQQSVRSMVPYAAEEIEVILPPTAPITPPSSPSKSFVWDGRLAKCDVTICKLAATYLSGPRYYDILPTGFPETLNILNVTDLNYLENYLPISNCTVMHFQPLKQSEIQAYVEFVGSLKSKNRTQASVVALKMCTLFIIPHCEYSARALALSDNIRLLGILVPKHTSHNHFR